jgi:hypothetical protein
MKRPAMMAMGLILTSAIAANAAETKRIHRTFPLPANGRVSLDTFKGTIVVTTWNQPSVDVDARIETDEDSSYPEDVQKTDVKFSAGGDSLRIESDYSNVPSHELTSWLPFGEVKILPYVRYTIRMPATARLTVDDHKSTIKVAGLRSDLRIDTHKGQVLVTDYDGAAEIETHKGNVRVEYARFSRPGSFETHKGEFDIRLPPTAAFNLDVESHQPNRVDSSFAMAGRVDSRQYHTRINGGGPELRFVTHSGTLRLRKA